jgi:hypothetical protein
VMFILLRERRNRGAADSEKNGRCYGFFEQGRFPPERLDGAASTAVVCRHPPSRAVLCKVLISDELALDL